MVIARKEGTVGQEENLSQIEGVIIKEKEDDDIKISFVEVTNEGEEADWEKTREIFNT